MVTGLNHLTLAVADLDASFDFYVDLLGFAPEARWDRGAYLSAGSLWLCLSAGAVARRDDYTHVAFSVPPGTFDACAARLIEAGVTRWQPNASEGDSLYFLDPDGHRLEIHDGDLASRLAAVDAAPYAGWTRHFPERSAVRLRAARAADVPALVRCARAAYAPYVARIGREPAPMVADLGASTAAGEVRVAVADGVVVGYLVTRPVGDALLLESVAVLPTHAGRGIGRRLIEAAEAEARAAGLARVSLYTNALMHENLSLYPRLGYVRTGERREDGFDRVHFAKELSP